MTSKPRRRWRAMRMANIADFRFEEADGASARSNRRRECLAILHSKYILWRIITIENLPIKRHFIVTVTIGQPYDFMFSGDGADACCRCVHHADGNENSDDIIQEKGIEN